MPLPMFERNWQFNVNQALPWTTDRPTTKRKYLWAIKNSMVISPSNPWQVVRSCDAVSIANGDLWTNYTKLIWSGTNNGGGNRSWCVLRQPAISPYFEMCIGHLWHGYYQYDYAAVFSLHFCPGGYDLTTGNLTTRPSPRAGAAEYNITNPSDSGDPFTMAGGSVDWNYVLHYIQSSDGLSTRVVVCQDGRVLTYLFIDVPKDVIPTTAQWPSPAVFNYEEATTNTSDFPNLDATVYNRYYTQNRAKTQFAGPTNSSIYFSGEHLRGGPIGQQDLWQFPDRRFWHGPNNFTGEWQMLPIGVVSHDVGGKRGRIGRLCDLWWGQTTIPTGAFYAAPGAAVNTGRHIQFGHMIFPWPSATPVVLV
jgi:hypothetical protein